MANITDNLDFQRVPPNAFVSPFTDRAPASFYSSIAIPGSAASKGKCLTCALQDLTAIAIEGIIDQFTQPSPSLAIREGLRNYPTTTTS